MKMTATNFQAEQHYCLPVLLELQLFGKLILAGVVTKYPASDRILLVPVASRSKAWICGRWLAGNVCSNPAGGLDVHLLLVLCVVRSGSMHRADHSSREVLPSAVCLNVIVSPR
jgi:hypothetical protein